MDMSVEGALHGVTDTMLPPEGKHAICNAMTRIVTTAYRLQAPAERKAVAIAGPAIVRKAIIRTTRCSTSAAGRGQHGHQWDCFWLRLTREGCQGYWQPRRPRMTPAILCFVTNVPRWPADNQLSDPI